jgi:hypothetical protein
MTTNSSLSVLNVCTQRRAANIPSVAMTTNSSLSVLNVCTQRHAANIRCIALAGAIPEPRRADERRS